MNSITYLAFCKDCNIRIDKIMHTYHVTNYNELPIVARLIISNFVRNRQFFYTEMQGRSTIAEINDRVFTITFDKESAGWDSCSSLKEMIKKPLNIPALKDCGYKFQTKEEDNNKVFVW